MIRAVLGSLLLVIAVATTAARTVAELPGPVDDPGLIARAKSEAQLEIYGVGPANLIDAKAKRFEATYGIKVAWLRLGGTAIPARLLTEQRAGRIQADVVIGESGLETEQIKRSGLYAQFRPPENRALLPGTFDPDGYWSAHEVYTENICYDPVRIRAAGLKPPKTWEDLAAKEWHGQFALFSGSVEWYATLKRFYGADRADALMRAYAANQPRLQSSHQLGVDLTVAGEVLAAANVFGYTCLLAKAKGASIEVVSTAPTILEVGTIGVLKDAPHPNAARLFDRWMLSREIEQWVVDDLGETAPRKDVKNDPRVLDPKKRYVVNDMTNIDAINADIKAFNAIFNIPT